MRRLRTNHKDVKISLEDVRKMYEQMEREQILNSYTFPTKPSSDGYYHVYVLDPTSKSGRKQIKAKDLDKLKVKVYEHEKQSTSKTFKDVFELVQEEKLKYVKDPEKIVSAKNTINISRSTYKRFFTGKPFEKLPIENITKEIIEDFCYEILSTENLKPKAFLAMRGVLKSVLDYAFEQYWIVDNPYKRINFKKYKDMLITPLPAKDRVYTEEEVRMFLEYTRKYQAKKPSYMPPYALELQILMGLRRGEIAPLTWDDITDRCISITKEQISIKNTRGGRSEKEQCVIVGHTKTYTGRQFPVTREIEGFLAKLRSVHDSFQLNSKYLFPDKNGPITNNVTYKYFVRMCRNLGVEISKDCIKGPHSFRRNGITKICNETGGNIMLASMLYGNSPESASKHYYTGIDLDQAKELLER